MHVIKKEKDAQKHPFFFYRFLYLIRAGLPQKDKRQRKYHNQRKDRG